MSIRTRAVGFLSFVLSLAAVWSAGAPSWVYVATGTELKAPQFSGLSPWNGDFLLGGAFNASIGHITRFSDEGALKWTTPLTVSSIGNGVGCGGVVGDNNGNQIAIFEFNGVLTVGASTFTTPSTGYGFVVVKFDPQGNVLWGQTVVGPSGISTYPAGLLHVDAQGNVYVFFAHTTAVAVGGSSLSADAFGRSGVVKFNSAGTLQWARDYSSSGNQGYVTIDSIAVDDSSVFVTGFFNKYVGWGNTNLTASSLTSFVGRLNAVNGSADWIRNTGSGAQGSQCALGPGGILWAKMALIGSWTLNKYQTNGALLTSVPGLNHSGKMRIAPNGEVVVVGGGAYLARFNTNGVLTYSSTNVGALTVGVTNATVFEVNADGDAYIVGYLATNQAKVAAAKVRAPGLAPEITVQPPNQTNQPNMFSGFQVSLTAVGVEPLSYQWRLKGTNVPGATARTLQRTGVTPDDAGGYDCVVSNSYGAVTSRVYQVTVSTPVNWTKLPTSQLVLLNQATLAGTNILSVDCTASALAGKTLTCTITNAATGWPASGTFDFKMATLTQFGGNYEFPSGGVFGYQANTYTIYFNAVGAVYLFLNKFPEFTSSSIIHFYAGGYYFLEPSSNPQKITSPGTYVISGGASTASFAVALNTGSGVSSVTYQWQKDGVDLPGATSATLAINPVTVAEAGLYRCVATVHDATGTLAYAVPSAEAPLRVVTSVQMPPASYTLAPGGTTMTISWAPGFVLQSTPSLSPPAWTTIATSSPFTATTTSGEGYFRIVPQ